MRLPVLFLSIATGAVCTGCSALAMSELIAPADARMPVDGAMVAAASLSSEIVGPLPLNVSGRWQRAADGLFYVKAAVNGVPVRFLVDTGASVTVLTQLDADRVGAVVAGPATTIATVGGATPMRWASIDGIAVGGKQIGSVSVAIVAQPRGVSLLGQNVLRQLSHVSIDGDQLTIG